MECEQFAVYIIFDAVTDWFCVFIRPFLVIAYIRILIFACAFRILHTFNFALFAVLHFTFYTWTTRPTKVGKM